MNIETLAMVSGAVSSYAYFPEIIKIWRNKDAKDISLMSFAIWTACSAIWLIYGVTAHMNAVIINYTIGLIGCASILALSLFFDIKNRKTAVVAGMLALAMIVSPQTWASEETVLERGQSTTIDGVKVTCTEAGQTFRLNDQTIRCR